MNSEFEQFRLVVLADEALQAELRRFADKKEFVARTVELAAEHGFQLAAEDVEDAMREGRRSWIEQGL